MKILFATDGSKFAANAAGLLSEMPALRPIDLSVLTVTYEPNDPEADSVRPWYSDYQKHIAERVELHYSRLTDLLGTACEQVHMMHLHGSPTHEILEAAKKEKPDLIVLGARGHSMLESLLLGSVSESVALHAPCSVLVLRPKDEENLEDHHQCQKITLAYDGSLRAQAAVEEMAALKWPDDTQFELLRVFGEPPTYGGEFGFVPPAFTDTEEVQSELDAVQSKLTASMPNVSTLVKGANHVGDAIVLRAKADNADLIVLGDSGHTPLGKLLLGSTTKYVLRNAHCSVWISRHQKPTN